MTMICARTLLIAVAFLSSPYVQQGTPQRTPKSAEERITNWLKVQDPDQDGRIARAEATGQMKLNFERIDIDNSGFLEREELNKLASRLQRNMANRATNANATNRQRSRLPTDAQVRQRAPEGVRVELNVAYREGNKAWTLDLAMPIERSAAPRPAIVFVHGGGWVSGDKRTAAFLNQALDYAKNGYVCITVNYRLDATKLPCIQDVKCAVRWLRAHADKYHIDPDRIGAYGNSAGAHLVTMLAISSAEPQLEGDGPWQEFSSEVQAVAASATPTAPRIRGTATFAAALIQPMNYISSKVPPMLLFHEESDRTVPVSNSDDFVKALREAGAKDVTYLRYTDGTGHGVFQRNIKETSAAMNGFFERTIGDPSQAGQNANGN